MADLIPGQEAILQAYRSGRGLKGTCKVGTGNLEPLRSLTEAPLDTRSSSHAPSGPWRLL